jgi:hypothetical protein
VQNILSSSLLSKNLKIKIHRYIFLPVVFYACETWSLTLRKEGRLSVFENRVLRRIFGPKRDEVPRTGDNYIMRRLTLELRSKQTSYFYGTGYIFTHNFKLIFVTFFMVRLLDSNGFKTEFLFRFLNFHAII